MLTFSYWMDHRAPNGGARESTQGTEGFCSPLGLHDQWTSLSTDGRLGHLLMHMQLETQAGGGYWLVHIVVPSIGLQIPSAPWLLSLAPPLGAL